MSTTTDFIAAEQQSYPSVLSTLARLVASFHAAQQVAAKYQQAGVNEGNARAIFDRSFDRI